MVLCEPLQLFFAVASASQKVDAAADGATVAMASAVHAPRNSPSRTVLQSLPSKHATTSSTTSLRRRGNTAALAFVHSFSQVCVSIALSQDCSRPHIAEQKEAASVTEGTVCEVSPVAGPRAVPDDDMIGAGAGNEGKRHEKGGGK